METAKLFYSCIGQVIRLSREFRFAEDRVCIRRLGNIGVLLPFGAPWHALLNGVDLFSADFMPTRPQGQVEARDSAFSLPPSDNP